MTDESLQPTLNSYHSNPYCRSVGAEQIAQTLYKRYGDKFTAYREAWTMAERGELPDFPVNVVFDLIDKCNLACPQCLRAEDLIGSYEGLLGTKQSLAFESILSVLDEAAAYDLPSVNIGGSGECTLHPDFENICRAVLARKVMELRVVTNGINLTNSLSEALVDMQLPIISISVDAVTAETYGKVRGKGHQYQTVVSNIEGLIAVRKRHGSTFPLIRLTFVEQPANAHEAEDFFKRWADKVDMIEVQSYIDYRATEYNADFSCWDPWKRMIIWADGRIGPCCGFPGIVYTMGRLGEKSIKEIWDDAPFRALRDILKAKQYNQTCLKCYGTRKASRK